MTKRKDKTLPQGTVEHPRLVIPGYDYECGARRLPIVEIRGRFYYRDDRWREYRDIDRPYARIPIPDAK